MEAFPGMNAMGLRMEPVEGDGNCLFRSFAVLRPEKDHREWREELVNLLEGIATAEHIDQQGAFPQESLDCTQTSAP